LPRLAGATLARDKDDEVLKCSFAENATATAFDDDVSMRRVVTPPPGPKPPLPRHRRKSMSSGGPAPAAAETEDSHCPTRPAARSEHPSPSPRPALRSEHPSPSPRPAPRSEHPSPSPRPRPGGRRKSIVASSPARSTSKSIEPSPARRRRCSSKESPARTSSKSSTLSKTPVPLDEEDERILTALFGAYATEFHEGQPVMRAPTLRDFFAGFLGEHKDAAIKAGMSAYEFQVSLVCENDDDVAASSDESKVAATRPLNVESFKEVMRAIDAEMQQGKLKSIIAQRSLASGGDLVLLAKALKSIRSLPPLPYRNIPLPTWR